MEIIPKSLGFLYMVYRGTTQAAYEGTVYPSDRADYKHKVVWDTGEISYFDPVKAESPKEVVSEKNVLDFKPNKPYIITQETEYCDYQAASDNFTDETRKKLEGLGWDYDNYTPWLKKGDYVAIITNCDANTDMKKKMYAVVTLNIEPRKWTVVLEEEIAEVNVRAKI